jgi:c-di-GMP-related signal transduction protein
MKLTSALEEGLRGDTINFLTLTNDILSREVSFLHEQIRAKDEINKALMQKLGLLERIQAEISEEDFNPIPGRKTLRTRIAESEARDREEYNKAIEDAEKIERAN